MKHIGNLTPAEGSRHKKKRVGRGAGSGHGGTSTRGHKGAKSRSGFKRKPSFEGGQMPLARRVPKFGFTNINRIDHQVVNVATLQRLSDEGRLADGVVTNEVLYRIGAVSKRSVPVKVLGNGELSAQLKVSVDKISDSAKAKIESAGGAVTVNV
jgi:large subunit ribosomal protein L15